MASATSAHSSPATLLFVVAVFLCTCATTPCLGGDEANASSPETRRSESSYVQMLKEWIANAMDRTPPTLMRRLLEADVTTECSLGLLKMMRGVRNLEPWALRLIDASGKYPTGAFQLSRADLGAFDECVETVLFNDYGEETARGQYCNLIVYPGNKTNLDDLISLAMQFTHPRLGKFTNGIYELRVPLLYLGVCTLSNCNQEELQKLIRAAHREWQVASMTVTALDLDRDQERDGVRPLRFGPVDWGVRPLGVVRDPDRDLDPGFTLHLYLDLARLVGPVVGEGRCIPLVVAVAFVGAIGVA
ncbi:hypothetical protein HPB49_017746 [Dermacentor silvarum]|uniref:Uncharacterized protein n=1 Tax=Dermacentor silvarum TaxID=543639 RepID=A0ACB8E1Z3_DERSI|nr:hypothetical protein HPB49_017746 [Dermacentor silvarum]